MSNLNNTIMWYKKFDNGEIKVYKSLQEIAEGFNLHTWTMEYDEATGYERMFDFSSEIHWQKVMHELQIKEFIEYEDTDIVTVYDINFLSEQVMYMLNELILSGEERGVFEEFTGDDAHNFNVISPYYGFSDKRMREICDKWNKGKILRLKATPVNQIQINFQDLYGG